MCHATREPAYGFHALRQAQLLFHPFSLGDVADHRQQIAVGHRGRDHFRREDRTVLAPELPLPVVIGFGFDHVQRRPDVRNFRRGHDVRGVQPDKFVAGITEHPAHARIGVEVVALRDRR